MKKGFILISTLSLVTILSFLTILISKQIFNDSVSTNIYQESIKKRIGDVSKIVTFPFHKNRVDPTEKFAS